MLTASACVYRKSRVDLEAGGDFGCGLVTLEGGRGDFGLE
jgi:hypothetical protein